MKVENLSWVTKSYRFLYVLTETGWLGFRGDWNTSPESFSEAYKSECHLQNLLQIALNKNKFCS